MKKKNKTRSNRVVRHLRIRKKVQGTPERPRLSVYPSLKNFEAQLVNDFEQKTLLGASTKSKLFRDASKLKSFGNVEAASKFGKFLAEKALEKGIQKVVFDRGGLLYHGRVRAFAEAAREQGLQF